MRAALKFLDPTCGNGQFLAAVLINKIQLGHKKPLDTIYGVDIMEDNVLACRKRLLTIMRVLKVGRPARNKRIVENNILCKDGLTYDYSFGENDKEDDAIQSDLDFLKACEK